MKIPAFLKKGDTVAIVAPAKAIEKKYIDNAKNFWEEKGFKVKIGTNCSGKSNYFSGTDAERTQDLQTAINDESVKAIICARGGYGCVRIVDRINWASFLNDPKWIVGFSDITVFHQRLAKLNIGSLHASMPLNYMENTSESLLSMVDVLKGSQTNYQWKSSTKNKNGTVTGQLIGGNMAVLNGLIGTNEMPDYCDKILFLEEVGEHLYKLDRMFFQLQKSGVLDQIRGLVLGGFTSTKDTDVPFGKPFEEIVKEHFQYKNIPLAFDFPAGHQIDNRALVFGETVQFKVDDNECSLISLT
ncbi:MAG: LD-carboxypeptidase [Brumimicrobium sp.]